MLASTGNRGTPCKDLFHGERHGWTKIGLMQTGRLAVRLVVMLIGSTVVRGFSALAEENALGEVATSGNRAWPAGNGWHGA